MLIFSKVVAAKAALEAALQVAFELSLSHDQRRRARLRLILGDEKEVGLLLERGLALKDGDCLVSEDGQVVAKVRAAPELLSRALTSDPHLLARAAYHLGNRHVALEVGEGALSYLHDHVLDGLCRELGLEVQTLTAPFEPELGGYSGEHDHGQHRH